VISPKRWSQGSLVSRTPLWSSWCPSSRAPVARCRPCPSRCKRFLCFLGPEWPGSHHVDRWPFPQTWDLQRRVFLECISEFGQRCALLPSGNLPKTSLATQVIGIPPVALTNHHQCATFSGQRTGCYPSIFQRLQLLAVVSIVSEVIEWKRSVLAVVGHWLQRRRIIWKNPLIEGIKAPIPTPMSNRI